jgi:hypothetical protein
MTDFTAALRTLRYASLLKRPSRPAVGSRIASVSVSDGPSETAAQRVQINTVFVNDAPVTSFAGGAVNSSEPFVENSRPGVPFARLSLTDVDGPNIVQVQVRLLSTSNSSDELLFVSQPALGSPLIVSTTDNGKAIFISGVATPAEYEALLKIMIYINTMEEPIDRAPLVSIQASDGLLTSEPSFVTMAIINTPDKPVVFLGGLGQIDFAATFVEETAPIPVAASNATITDSDSDTFVLAIVTLTEVEDGVAEGLSLDSRFGRLLETRRGRVIDYVILPANTTRDGYAEAFQALRYYNNALEPLGATREAAFIVTSGDASSFDSSTTITIERINDNAPVFNSPGSSFVRSEGLAAGSSLVSSVVATDADVGVDGNIRYSIAQVSQDPDMSYGRVLTVAICLGDWPSATWCCSDGCQRVVCN